jgi:CHAD domain-containing protein
MVKLMAIVLNEPEVKGVTEEDLENLFRKQPIALKKAEEYTRSLTKAEWHRLRILAKKNRFFLSWCSFRL